MNYYEILEVSQNASPEVIKAAYKSLMQRYHPDRNPDNAGIAAHALQVNQAYEVLSDSGKRTAYDVTLQQQLTDSMYATRGGNGSVNASYVTKDLLTPGARESYGLLWLLIVLIILVCTYAMYMLNKAPKDDFSSTFAAIPGQEAIERPKQEQPRTIPVFISDINVEIIGTDFSGNVARVLNIPALGVKVGALDAENILRLVDDNKEHIRKELEAKLAGAKYDDLVNPDGEQYLKNMVIDSIGETTGIKQNKNSLLNGSDAEQYGIVDILLPRSFSVQ